MVKNFYKDKKVLITGNTGFKGSWLSMMLLELGADVRGLSLISNTHPSMFAAMNLDYDFLTYYTDIRDYYEVKEVFDEEKPEIVFHLAAQALVRDGYKYPKNTFTTNAIGTLNVLDCMKNSKSCKAGVIVTTDKVYANNGCPYTYRENDELGGNDPYSASKTCAEHITKAYRESYSLNVATARAGNVIGGGDWAKDRLIPDIIRSKYDDDLVKQPVIIRNPAATRPWQHVLDPLYGYLVLGQTIYENPNSCATSRWNFAPQPGNNLTVKEIVEQSGIKYTTLDYLPRQLYESNSLDLDATKARKYLGWQAKLNIHTALKWTYRWYEHFYHGSDIRGYTLNQIHSYFGLVR